MTKSRSKSRQGPASVQNKQPAGKSGNRSRIVRWMAIIGGLLVVVVLLTGGSLAAATQVENRDSFCASCHTQPESEFYQRSLADPVDLASAHTASQVDCIQCHSGPGTAGRLQAISSVAAPDLVHYLTKNYHDPAVITIPIGDDHCLKCHSDVSANKNFNNHFHAFLPQWQELAPDSAATCTECHQGHMTGGSADIAFVQETTARAVCERCHAFAGRR